MPIDIEPPRIRSKETPREILSVDFKSIGELPIKGGWGYSIEDAVIIDRDDPIVPKGMPFDGISIEYVFVEKRICEELIIFQPVADRYADINWRPGIKKLTNRNNRSFDVLTFEVTAIKEKVWLEMLKEIRGSGILKSGKFDGNAYEKMKLDHSVRYIAEYWFDITSFFGRE